MRVVKIPTFFVCMGIQPTPWDLSYEIFLWVLELQEWIQGMGKVWFNFGFEWILEDIINYFKLLSFKKGLKLYYSAIGKMYLA